MATAKDDEVPESWISIRAHEDLKRFAGMRAEQLGLDRSEYIRQLIRDDLEDVDYAKL